uniref:ABC transporter domain-containing protein n=1 Tax=Oryza meridionalis TaxID=40149 RepID=A0A0E0FCJ2_9ORYZ
MTVRETLDFSSRCQGVGRRPKILKEVSARESAAGIIPDADIDIYMKAIAVEASKRSLQTDYILKIMGLEICADTMVGDAMIRGLSGGQKKRLTTAEMIVGPARAYFMDEISNGLDSSTTFQIISCFQQLTNISEYTMVISLLQPTPEVFDLFDDLILMAEGKIIYHGPRNEALNFFEEFGFICPERKEVADFLQEILSCKDQQQYWSGPNESYRYISPHELSSMFKENHRGRKLEEPIVSPKSELGKEALAFNKYSLQKLEMFKACGAREALLMKRTSMPRWLNWGFWISPMTYAEIGTVINEFHAPRWQKETIENITIGNRILINHGLYYTIEEYHGSRPIKRLCQEQEKDSNIRKESDGHSNISRAKMTIPVMELPITFHKLNYYIDTPLEMLKQGYPTKRLQLLNNITGALRPGVLSALMGVSGAGKTTLLDVLAGRKTGGYIEGDIRIGGYPKVQETFVRILGYCEQADIHSPQLTEFVAEVLETVELDQIKDVLVGTPQKNGLSMEQRKRLTIAVELVSNPSVILMDEPTTGLDTRSAAIVIRAVKNICKTGRTVVCTIHQPSTEIFEAFDELILMKNGGKVIYSGPIGERSSKKISGVSKVKSNCNPAAWMMDVTSTSMEVQHNMDFAILYDESSQHRDTEELVEKLSIPIPNSEILSFSHRFPRNGWIQLKACLWKQNITYWRSPEYNLRRIMLTVISALVYGVLFWKRAKILNDEQDLFNVLGAMYLGSTTIGSYNHQSIIPFSTTERIVMYREKFAGMYSSWSYSFAQAAIEIPYVFIQVVLYTLIIYPSIGYYWTPHKFIWFFYTTFCSSLSYIYVGLLLVSLTPNVQVATILASFFNTMQTLFSGFILPAPQIPKWWVWLYYLTPTSWTLNALLTSQYGNIEKEVRAFGETKSVSIFLNDYFGFHKDKLSLVAAVLITFPFVLIILFSLSIEKFNFQKRLLNASIENEHLID